MYNGGKIIIGIIIFVILFTSPFWSNFLSSAPKEKPEPIPPTQYKECVADKDYMTANHMDLLNQWRDLVVRSDTRFLKVNGKELMLNGKPAEMSLSKTCIGCHTSKKDFCDKCHNYLGVTPYCWDCHVDPAITKPFTPPINSSINIPASDTNNINLKPKDNNLEQNKEMVK